MLKYKTAATHIICTLYNIEMWWS